MSPQPTTAVSTAAAKPAAGLPSPALKHVLDRVSYGCTPALVREARAAGGGGGWLAAQLRPAALDDPASVRLRSWFPTVGKSSARIWEDYENGGREGWQVGLDLSGWTMLQRVHSRRQLQERMVEFWSNLIHVPGYEDNSWPARVSYDAAIRRHALGTFRDLLLATTTHPAMLCFLDGVSSTKSDLNENHGRELLELHTVGVEAGYGEDAVRDSARILTGWQVDRWATWGQRYDPELHATGPVSVLGFTDPNRDADGRALTRRYLRHLADHPSTARRIARRLCVHFVRDDPPAAVVDAVASAYRRSGTDVRATLRALFAHPAFAASRGRKARTPGEDAIATLRALDVRATRPGGDDAFGISGNYLLADLGQRPYSWPAPNGFPDTAAEWSSVGRMLASWNFHRSMTYGWWPRTDVEYVPPLDRFRGLRFPATLREVVGHVAPDLLQTPVPPWLVEACARLLDLEPTSSFASREELAEWRAGLVVATVLDHPQHLQR